MNKHKLQTSSSDSMIIHNKVIDNIKNEDGNNNSLSTPINQLSSISNTTTSTTPIITNNNNSLSITTPINSSSLTNNSNLSTTHSLSFTPIKKIDIESEFINV